MKSKPSEKNEGKAGQSDQKIAERLHEEPDTSPGHEPQNYEATIALSREELMNIGMQAEQEPPQQDHQATVAISKEELRELGLKTSQEPEPDSAPEPQQDYQATVAISKEELETLGLKAEPEPEPDPAPEPQQDYQATVAISKDELRSLGLKAEDESEPVSEPQQNHQATVAISKEELRELGLGAGPEPEAPPSPDLSREVPVIPDIPLAHTDFGSTEFEASALETEYYHRAVKRGHGAGKYRFQRNLVSGGMGSILDVMDQDLQRPLAMKVILSKFKGKEDTLTDFIAEAKITGLLEHPNIIPVHELSLTQETGLFFTMKLLTQGEALIDILNEIRKGNPEYVEKYNTYHLLNIFRKVCDAVSFSHSRDIVHQDIKPHNIMVAPYGEVLLMDWGIATFVGDLEAEKDPAMREFHAHIMALTQGKDDIIKGSPTYMSPEQVQGDPRFLDRRSDIFLLGATLYHMFTFEAPYFGKDIYEIIHKAEAGELIPPQLRNPSRQIPEEICRIIMKAMAHEKADRYQRVEELASDIDDLISGKWSQQEKRMFSAGEMLMRQGETGEEAYLILKGKVQVFIETDDRRVDLATLKEGDVIGEMALISKEKLTRSASVEALERTEAAVLTKHVISQNLKKLPPYMEKIVSTLTDRLRAANENVHPHLSGDAGYYILKQLRMIFRDRSDSKIEKFKLPVQEVIKEISDDLGISTQRVKEVLLKAAKAKLIAGRRGMVRIPDLVELTRFTNFEKEK